MDYSSIAVLDWDTAPRSDIEGTDPSSSNISYFPERPSESCTLPCHSFAHPSSILMTLPADKSVPSLNPHKERIEDPESSAIRTSFNMVLRPALVLTILGGATDIIRTMRSVTFLPGSTSDSFKEFHSRIMRVQTCKSVFRKLQKILILFIIGFHEI